MTDDTERNALREYAKHMKAWCARTQHSLNDPEDRAALIGTHWMQRYPYADDVQPVVRIDEVTVTEPVGAHVHWRQVDPPAEDCRGSDCWVDFLFQFDEVEPLHPDVVGTSP